MRERDQEREIPEEIEVDREGGRRMQEESVSGGHQGGQGPAQRGSSHLS